jgi:hypothetical protein
MNGWNRKQEVELIHPHAYYAHKAHDKYLLYLDKKEPMHLLELA